MTFVIRNVTIDDAPLLAHLNMAVQKPHINAMPDRFREVSPDNPDLIDFFRERLSREESHTFIAEVDGEPVGYAHCLFQQIAENVLVYGLLDFHIDQIAVLESHQGQGVGQALMAHATQVAKDLKADRMSLGVVAFNQGAIRFYERLGFEITSHRMGMSLDDKTVTSNG